MSLRSAILHTQSMLIANLASNVLRNVRISDNGPRPLQTLKGPQPLRANLQGRFINSAMGRQAAMLNPSARKCCERFSDSLRLAPPPNNGFQSTCHHAHLLLPSVAGAGLPAGFGSARGWMLVSGLRPANLQSPKLAHVPGKHGMAEGSALERSSFEVSHLC